MAAQSLCDPAYVCDPMAWWGLGLMLVLPVLVVVEAGVFIAFGPTQHILVHCRLAFAGLKLLFKNPAVALLVWAYTTTPDFPIGLVFLRYLASFVLAMAVMIGGGLAMADWVKGPMKEKYVRNLDGTLGTVRTRVRVKHRRPEKLDKAIKEVTPHRNRIAYRIAKKCEAREADHYEAGVAAPPRKWWEKQLIQRLPVEKARTSKAGKKIVKDLKKAEKNDLRAELEVEKAQLDLLPPPPGGKPTEGHLSTLPPPPYEGVLRVFQPEPDETEEVA